MCWESSFVLFLFECLDILINQCAKQENKYKERFKKEDKRKNMEKNHLHRFGFYLNKIKLK